MSAVATVLVAVQCEQKKRYKNSCLLSALLVAVQCEQWNHYNSNSLL